MGRNSGKNITLMVLTLLAGLIPLRSKDLPDLALLKDRVERGDMVALKEMSLLPPSVAIKELRNYAFLGSFASERSKHPGVSEEAIRLLVQIPGHAKDSINRIGGARSENREYYNMVRGKEFNYLALLKSDETIRVLGRYLMDTYRPPPPTPYDPEKSTWKYEDSNALLAMFSLAKMDLRETPKLDYHESHISLGCDRQIMLL